MHMRWVLWKEFCVTSYGTREALIDCFGIAFERALCLGKEWKNREERELSRERVRVCRQTFGTATFRLLALWLPINLSARSSSVTWVHWNVINFACRQHTTFTSCQNAAFSNTFFLWPVVLQVELNLSNFYQSRTIGHRFWHTLSLRQILARILINLTVGTFGLAEHENYKGLS